ASVLDTVPKALRLLAENDLVNLDELKGFIHGLVGNMVRTLESLNNPSLRRQELVAEAASRLVISSIPIFQAATLVKRGWNNEDPTLLRTGASLIGKEVSEGLLTITATFDSDRLAEWGSNGLVSALGDILPSWLELVDEELEESVDAIPKAALT